MELNAKLDRIVAGPREMMYARAERDRATRTHLPYWERARNPYRFNRFYEKIERFLDAGARFQQHVSRVEAALTKSTTPIRKAAGKEIGSNGIQDSLSA
jgi:hypothetical protein